MLEAGTLLVERARVAGRLGKAGLEHEIAGVDVGSITPGDEVLLVRRLQVTAAFSRSGRGDGLASSLTNRLRGLRDSATIDPDGLAPGVAALRFTTRARFAAWVVATWLSGPSARSLSGSAMPQDTAQVRAWIAREVLPHGQLLISVARQLHSLRLLPQWVARLHPREMAIVRETLHLAFAVPFPDRSEGWAAAPQPSYRAGTLAKPIADQAAACDRGATPVLRQLAQCWSALVAADPLIEAFEAPRAQILLALAALVARPNVGRQLHPEVLRRVVAPERRQDASPLSPNRSPHRFPAATAPVRPRRAVDAPPPTPVDAKLRHREEPVPVPQLPPPYNPSGPVATRQSAKARAADLDCKATPVDREGETDGESIAQQWLETRFGGIFFLINILLSYGFYPDFTRPRDRGLNPSPFWLLDRLGRLFFGRAYLADPLCKWLRSVGCAGPLPSAWEVDPAWLRGLPSGRYGFRRSPSRTILWDRRGFALADMPGSLDRAALLDRYASCGTLAPLADLPGRSIPRNPDARWIACLAEFLAARIALAGEGLSIRSLELAARLQQGEDRIDVIFSLADLPIGLRLAGLDRDPGWLPAEGCSIYFGFE